MRGCVRIRVERRGEQSVLVACDGHIPLAPRRIPAPTGWARVALVQTVAGLLSGDEVEIEVEVGEGAALELIGNAATLVYPARRPASQTVRCSVGAGGRFAWLPQPLVLAAGCDFRGSLQLDLAPDAVAVVRETVVLGRYGEVSGRCDATFRCDLAGTPLLRDRVCIDETSRRSPVELGGAAVYTSLALLGARPAERPRHDELDLAGPGRLLRSLARDAAEAELRTRPVEDRFLAELATVPSGAPRLTG